MKNKIYQEDKKFKNNVLVIRFSSQITEEIVTKRVLLGLMLVDRSQEYPSKRALNKALNDNFVSSLRSQTTSYGSLFSLEISISFLKNKYCRKDNHLQVFKVLNSVINRPLLTEVVFKEAKKVLKDYLLRIDEHPQEFTVLESLKIAGQGYPLGISNQGSLVELEKLSLKDIQKEYQELFKNSNISWSFLGETLKEEDFEKFLITKTFDYASYYNFKVKKPRLYEITKPIEQTYLSLVYNTDYSYEHVNYLKMQLFNLIFGGLPGSLLFKEIRENKGYAYSIRSSYFSFDGVVVVSAGIALGKEQEVSKIIAEKLKYIRDLDFSDELLSTAKAVYLNQINSLRDLGKSQLDFIYRQSLVNRQEALSTIKKKLSEITKSDIGKCAESLSLNTTVILKGGTDAEARK